MVTLRSGKVTVQPSTSTPASHQIDRQNIEQKTFSTLHELAEGLVFIGCGGDITEWVNGILETLESEKLCTEDSL